MEDQELKVVKAMDKTGGNFVKSLAQAFIHADRINFNKLRDAFPEYWEEYRKMAEVKTGETGKAPRVTKVTKTEKNGKNSKKS